MEDFQYAQNVLGEITKKFPKTTLLPTDDYQFLLAGSRVSPLYMEFGLTQVGKTSLVDVNIEAGYELPKTEISKLNSKLKNKGFNIDLEEYLEKERLSLSLELAPNNLGEILNNLQGATKAITYKYI